MIKILAALLVFPVVCVISWLQMTFGWGLTVQNWPAYLGLIGAHAFIHIVMEALKS